MRAQICSHFSISLSTYPISSNGRTFRKYKSKSFDNPQFSRANTDRKLTKKITHKNASKYRSEVHTNATNTSICGFSANTKII